MTLDDVTEDYESIDLQDKGWLEKAEILKDLLVAYSTGTNVSESTYRELRGQFLAHPQAKELVPKFVRTCRNLGEFWGFIKEVDGTYAGRRRHLAEVFDPLLTFFEQPSLVPSDELTGAAIGRLDNDYIVALWHKALERRTSDAEGAITLARTLLEATCKHVLHAAGVSFDDKADLPKLYFLCAKELNLAPAQHTEDIFKQILGGCQSVVQGLGSLRSKLGDAHAQGAKRVKPSARHAELAVNLSGAMATFILATWEHRTRTDLSEDLEKH